MTVNLFINNIVTFLIAIKQGVGISNLHVIDPPIEYLLNHYVICFFCLSKVQEIMDGPVCSNAWSSISDNGDCIAALVGRDTPEIVW